MKVVNVDHGIAMTRQEIYMRKYDMLVFLRFSASYTIVVVTMFKTIFLHNNNIIMSQMCRRSGVYLGNSYGSGTGRIWLDNLRCRGSETSFADCSRNGWGSHNCGHHEDVSIACLTGTFIADYCNRFIRPLLSQTFFTRKLVLNDYQR